MPKTKYKSDILGSLNTYASLPEVAATIREFEFRVLEEGWKNVHLEFDVEYDTTSVVFRGERPETKEERERRIWKELKARDARARSKAAQEEKDRAQYEKMKTKYGWT